MPLAINLEFYTESPDEPSFVIQPYWWSCRDLMNQYQFANGTQEEYPKYRCIVTEEQLVQINKDQAKNMPADERLTGAIAIAGIILKTISRSMLFKKIQILIYEWEAD